MSFSLNTIGSNFIVKNGTIGIGVDASSNFKLHISCNITNMTTDVFPLKISAGGASNVSGRGTFMGLGTQNLNHVKCAIGHVRISSNDIGDIVFLNRATNDTVSCGIGNEIMRITNSNVGILKSNPSSAYALDVGGTINATGLFVGGQAFVGGSGSSTSAGWVTSNATTIFTTSNVAIGSNVVATDKLEVYGGDIDVINGVMKRTQLNTTILRTFAPHIWYQFNENPYISSILTDSGTSSIKYNMSVTTPNLTITKVTGYSTSSYPYPNAFKFSAVNVGTDFIINTTSANIRTLLNNIYTSNSFSINFIFYATAPNAFTIFRISDGTKDLIRIEYTSSRTISFGINYTTGNAAISFTTAALTDTVSYNIQCIFTYSAGTQTISMVVFTFNYSNSSANTPTAAPLANASGTFSSTFQNVQGSLTMQLGSGTSDADTRIQDFRMFMYALNTDERTALRTGRVTWNNSNINFIENYGIERWKDSSTYNKINGSNFIYYNDGSVGIGTSTVSIGNEVEIYGGDLNITNANMKKTTVGDPIPDPMVWYQFNQDPFTSLTLNDSNVLGTKFNLTNNYILANNAFFTTNTDLLFWYKFDNTTTKGLNSGTASSATLTLNNGADIDTNDYPALLNNVGSLSLTPKSTISALKPKHASMPAYNYYNSAINAYTFCLWAEITQLNTSYDSLIFTSNAFVAGGPNDIYMQRYITGEYWSIGFLGQQLNTENFLSTYSWNSANLNRWNHYAFVAKKNAQLKIDINFFINGISVANVTGTSVNWPTATQTRTITFGNPIGNDNNLIGNLDDIRIYKRELTSTQLLSLCSRLNKRTGYTANGYLYQNAYMWYNLTGSTNHVFLRYSGSANNIQSLLNKFHNNRGFSIHFVFMSLNITSTSQILYIGNTSPGDLIRVFITNSIFSFKIGNATTTATISANTYYVTDLVFTYITGGNMSLSIYFNGKLYNTNSDVQYGNILSSVTTTGLEYYIGKYTDANDATPVTLQDFRIYSDKLSYVQINSLQKGNIARSVPLYVENYVKYTYGNVGIGTDNPVSDLHLHNISPSSDVRIILNDSSTGSGAEHGFHIAKTNTSNAVIWNYENADMVFGTNNTEKIRIIGNTVGIGAYSAINPIEGQLWGLDVFWNIRCNGTFRISRGTNSYWHNYWQLAVDAAVFGSGNLYLYRNTAIVGYFSLVNGAYTLNFTGQHRTISLDKKLYDNIFIGYIVSSEGKYKEINSKFHKNNIKHNIIVNDALPYVKLTSKICDKSVFGVISDRLEEDIKSNKREYSIGFMVSLYDKEAGDDRLVVNGCGEGSIWVSDYNGSLENGDYITTSPIPGIGMKQDDDLLHNYTVAKITMDCDFNPEYIPVQVIKQVEYTINSSNVATSNMIDENGDPVYEYKLDENSNIVYDYEYDMKYIKLDGTIVSKDYYEINCEIEKIYKMAFVGCSYKCS
jgi:hypothetical protein